MHKCARCGGRLRRVHRTFLERFSYMAIFECRDCRKKTHVARRYKHHFGDACRCPRCGTYRVIKLKERDHIDPMETGFLNLLERIAGGALHHCRYCRVQFYDRRSTTKSGSPETPDSGSPVGASTGATGADS